jgi:hypothetical protein
MHFIIISKKEKFKETDINDSYLQSNEATSLIADNNIKTAMNNFIIYLYTYNQSIEEKKGYSYYFNKNKVLIANGLFNINNKIRNDDIQKVFKNVNNDSELFGDYQLIQLDNEGNGFFKTPQFSFRQLFYYEDEKCSVLSTANLST